MPLFNIEIKSPVLGHGGRGLYDKLVQTMVSASQLPAGSVDETAYTTYTTVHTHKCRHCGYSTLSRESAPPTECRQCGGRAGVPSRAEENSLTLHIARGLFAIEVNDEALRIAESIPFGSRGARLFRRDPSDVVAIMWTKTKLDVRKRCEEQAEKLVDAMRWDW